MIGGESQNRTGVYGFAIRCITTMLFRHIKNGAGNESRTRDLNLGKVALYQLSYSRVEEDVIIGKFCPGANLLCQFLLILGACHGAV